MLRVDWTIWSIWVGVIGIVAGFVASKLLQRSGREVWIDIILGIAGAFLGAWIYGGLELVAYGLVGRLIMAGIGAALLLGLVRAITKT
jgi:uncharacterized membrane protein YeaQ/YmgE (transglycosylase-associated protein family)